MKKPTPLKVLDNGYIFEFESISPLKTLKKVVEFSEFDVETFLILLFLMYRMMENLVIFP